MSGAKRTGRRRIYFFWDPLTAAMRVVVCAGIIFVARRWVPGVVEAFMRLDPVAQGRAAALAVRVAAIAWMINGAAVIMIRRPVPPAPADGEQRRFERWVDAQPEASRDRRAAAQRLRPAWEAWQARGRIDGPGRARHEAAHAVVARALGHTILSADIRHAGDRSGHVEFVPPLPSRGMGPDLWDELTIAVAGSALDLAEGRRHAGSRDDIQLAEATAAALISTGHTPEGADGPPGTIARATAAARDRAARILTDHRDQVDVLAAALIRRRRLTGRQIHDLLQHRPEKK